MKDLDKCFTPEELKRLEELNIGSHYEGEFDINDTRPIDLWSDCYA